MTPCLFDYLGYFGPVIISVVLCIILRKRPNMLLLYVFFLIINTVANGLLKLLIGESRPVEQRFLTHFEKETDSHTYGMPSGHAQSVSYTIAFVYLFSHSPSVLVGVSFIGALTLYQRYKFSRHYVSQLLAGMVIGALIALFGHAL